jgi:hypothetical protein
MHADTEENYVVLQFVPAGQLGLVFWFWLKKKVNKVIMFKI